MKIKLLTGILLFSGITARAQTFAELDINNIKAGFNAGGDLFWDFQSPKFEAPKGSGTHSIFAANLWVGGMDALGQLHVAAQTYLQNADYWPGPLDTISASCPAAVTTSPQWNRVWKINKSTIDSFKLGLFMTIPSSILSWPGNGYPAYNQYQFMAPFFDNNGNGIYEPSNGDYPIIRGDQAVYFIFNDNKQGAIHMGAKGGLPLRIEVHGMAYAFKTPSDSALNNTIFLYYKIINRSSTTYLNCYTGMWVDFDIGYYGDDFIGCDVTRQAFYGYNGLASDGTGAPGTYGLRLGAQAVVFLNGIMADAMDGVDNNKNCVVDEPCEGNLMSKFLYYDNVGSVTGNPDSARHFYRYMTGRWQDNTSMTYGGSGYLTGAPCSYMYPDNSDQQWGWGLGGTCNPPNLVPSAVWNETIAGNHPPGDRRGMSSSGPFTMQPGRVYTLDLAYVFGRDYTASGIQQSLNVMKTRIDNIRTYVSQNSTPCGGIFDTAVEEYHTGTGFISVYPNPVNDILHIGLSGKTKNAVCEIYDITGKKLFSVSHLPEQEIDVSGLAGGLYLIRIIDGENFYSQKFLKE